MGIKVEMGGKGMAMLSNDELGKLADTKGKKGNKARMELVKRKVKV